MARRFFVDKTNISGNNITITGNEHLHLTKVLRAKPKDKIDVSTLDFSYVCEIETITKDKTICKILQKEKITLIDNVLRQSENGSAIAVQLRP